MTAFEATFPSMTGREETAPLPRALDAVSLSALVDAHSATLYRVAYSVVRHAEDAEDVVQETYASRGTCHSIASAVASQPRSKTTPPPS